MEFATEMIAEVSRNHLIIKEVTVPLTKARNERTNKLPGWVDGAGWGEVSCVHYTLQMGVSRESESRGCGRGRETENRDVNT